MVIGGRTQYLTRVQGMPRDIEDALRRAEHVFLWEGKRARVAHETMMLNVSDGGKQILDIPSRNEAIALWNLKSYLTQGEQRASWCYFVDYILAHYLETSYLNVPSDQIVNGFLQDIHVPISIRTNLPEDIKQMILAARKFNLKFTGLSFSKELKVALPMWKHPGVNRASYQRACRRDSAKCLRLNHAAYTV
ncbi:hypothetical protein C8R45DRAFT_842964, partial [Mycena sanguinolenta]